MAEFALALGVLAGLVQLAGYWQYNRIMSSSLDHKPNAATWFMWGIGGGVELLAYGMLIEHQADSTIAARAKEILPAVCALAVTLTFMRVWWHTRVFSTVEWYEWLIVALDALVVAVLFLKKDFYLANLLIGIDIVATFIPLITSVWKDPMSEDPRPWGVWVVAYALLTAVVIILWENWWELLYPVLYLVFCLIVCLIAKKGRMGNAAIN